MMTTTITPHTSSGRPIGGHHRGPSNRGAAPPPMLYEHDGHAALIKALREHRVSAQVVDFDHYRIRSGMAVETDYIIEVKDKGQKSVNAHGIEEADFETFRISKSYSAFRTLSAQLKKAQEISIAGGKHNNNGGLVGDILSRRKLHHRHHQQQQQWEDLSKQAKAVVKFSEMISHHLDSQPTQYLGKVSYSYVKSLAKQRSATINFVLDIIGSSFPPCGGATTIVDGNEEDAGTAALVAAIETFFLTDHCVEVSGSDGSGRGMLGSADGGASCSIRSYTKKEHGFAVDAAVVPDKEEDAELEGGEKAKEKQPEKEETSNDKQETETARAPAARRRMSLQQPLVPLTRRRRRSIIERAEDVKFLQEVGTELILDDERSPANIMKTLPSYSAPKPVVAPPPKWDNSPVFFSLIFAACITILRFAALLQLSMDADVFLLVVFAFFCIGLHTPRRPSQQYNPLWSPPPVAVRSPVISFMETRVERQTTTSRSTSSISATPLLIKSFAAGDEHHHRSNNSSNNNSTSSLSASEMPSTVNDTKEPESVVSSTGREGDNMMMRQQEQQQKHPLNRDEYDLGVPETSARTSDTATTATSTTVTTTTPTITPPAKSTEPTESAAPTTLGSPLPRFPDGAELGSHFNCYSESISSDFLIRGPNYLKDKKKVPSLPFLFPIRGVDLFLTDACPENIGINEAILGGQLREVPTFIINFRLPWGVFVCYFEIPERFLPFLRKRYNVPESPEQDTSNSLPSLDEMTPGDRTCCRFLLGSDEYRNKCLKIVPVVVNGPWVVKSVVGGKPAIVGNKMPVHYTYQPATTTSADGKRKAEYLEVDLDIVASAAARGILSVTRAYTNILTMDLGFVVQSNEQDELPEQMLVGTRVHGIDPVSAPTLPPMKNTIMFAGSGGGDGANNNDHGDNDNDDDDDNLVGGDSSSLASLTSNDNDNESMTMECCDNDSNNDDGNDNDNHGGGNHEKPNEEYHHGVEVVEDRYKEEEEEEESLRPEIIG